MVRTLPSGVISLDAAVEQIARNARNGNLYPTIVYRDEAVAAWRKLCKLSEDRVRPLMLTADGFVQPVDRTQFLKFKDEYWKFASVLRYPPNSDGVQEVNKHCPSHDLLDETGRLHRGARLVFLESEIETAFGMAADPTAMSKPSPATVLSGSGEQSGSAPCHDRKIQATDAEIDEMIRSVDEQYKRSVGVKMLWKIAQQKIELIAPKNGLPKGLERRGGTILHLKEGALKNFPK
jgi:hypothetical protein